MAGGLESGFVGYPQAAVSPTRSLLLFVLSGGPWLVPVAHAWPDGPAPGTEPSECVDLSSVPVRYDIQYSMDDWPFGTDPASVTTIYEDVLQLSAAAAPAATTATPWPMAASCA